MRKRKYTRVGKEKMALATKWFWQNHYNVFENNGDLFIVVKNQDKEHYVSISSGEINYRAELQKEAEEEEGICDHSETEEPLDLAALLAESDRKYREINKKKA